MRVKLKRIEVERRYNVAGDKVNCRYGYIIAACRWLRKPMYLRLLPGWFDGFLKGEPCKVELTSHKGQATEFREDEETSNYLKKSIALEVIEAIRSNPNNFILS